MKKQNVVDDDRIQNLRGFTLIELLIVIAIIAILASILFPVFARARENARRSACQSNVKQIMLGVMQYTQDYDERYPLRYYSGKTAPTGAWAAVIQPYLKSTQIYQCPSDADTTPLQAGTYDYHLSYLGNSIASGSSTDTYGLFAVSSPISIAQVVSASTTIAITDGAYKIQLAAPFYDRDISTWVKTTQSFMLARANPLNQVQVDAGYYGAPADRHLETVVVGFADGHVKAQKLDSVYDSASPACMNYKTGCS